ncbi:hypothetical protein [Novipirellula maiorica]|nr:hypothetical protein [Rhodopirellula maiorica]
MKKLDSKYRPVTSVWGNAPNRLRIGPKSILATIWVSVVLLGGGNLSAELPGSLQQLGRIVGVGWGDGYHACKCSEACLCADMPPRPYCEGNCDGQCGHGNCSACGDVLSCDAVPCDSKCGLPKKPSLFTHRILGNVNETGLALKAGALPACRNVPCNDLHCKAPECKLKLQGNVNETGLAIKAVGAARYSKPLCDLSLPRPHFRTPLFRQLAPKPTCDTTCDVSHGPVNEFPANEFPVDHSGSGYSIDPSLPHPETDSPFIEVPADSAMNQTQPKPKQPVEGLAAPVVEPETRVAVSVLAAPQPSPEPVVETRRPVRIAEGKFKPKSTATPVSTKAEPAPPKPSTPAAGSPLPTVASPVVASPVTVSPPAKTRIAISNPLPNNVKVNHFVEAAAGESVPTKPTARSPQRLPAVQ